MPAQATRSETRAQEAGNRIGGAEILAGCSAIAPGAPRRLPTNRRRCGFPRVGDGARCGHFRANSYLDKSDKVHVNTRLDTRRGRAYTHVEKRPRHGVKARRARPTDGPRDETTPAATTEAASALN